MANSQAFTTIDKQIEILVKRNLKFESVQNAKLKLDTYGYYNIINGYKDPYVYIKNEDELYKEDVTFERIYSLFNLDRSVRNQIMRTEKYLLDFQIKIQSNITGKLMETSLHGFY